MVDLRISLFVDKHTAVCLGCDRILYKERTELEWSTRGYRRVLSVSKARSEGFDRGAFKVQWLTVVRQLKSNLRNPLEHMSHNQQQQSIGFHQTHSVQAVANICEEYFTNPITIWKILTNAMQDGTSHLDVTRFVVLQEKRFKMSFIFPDGAWSSVHRDSGVAEVSCIGLMHYGNSGASFRSCHDNRSFAGHQETISYDRSDCSRSMDRLGLSKLRV
ncbi:hypothetical protein CBL_12280 [Carabus blaptoides fortunei]